jgi:hypothetical protein
MLKALEGVPAAAAGLRRVLALMGKDLPPFPNRQVDKHVPRDWDVARAGGGR